MKLLTSSVRSSSGFTRSTSPTSPISTRERLPLSSVTTIRILRDLIRSPSLPDSPTARPPIREIVATRSLLILCSTISAASIVAGSVTRIPRTKRDLRPSIRSSAVICAPPPCTIIGLMPTKSSSTTSCAKLSRSSSVCIACPPYLMTNVLPRNRRIYGSASISTSARLWMASFTRQGTSQPKGKSKQYCARGAMHARVALNTSVLVVSELQNIAGQILVLDDLVEAAVNVCGVDRQLFLRQLRRVEG